MEYITMVHILIYLAVAEAVAICYLLLLYKRQRRIIKEATELIDLISRASFKDYNMIDETWLKGHGFIKKNTYWVKDGSPRLSYNPDSCALVIGQGPAGTEVRTIWQMEHLCGALNIKL